MMRIFGAFGTFETLTFLIFLIDFERVNLWDWFKHGKKKC